MAKKQPATKSIILNIIQQSATLTRKDIAAWRSAHQSALNIGTWSRNRLYDIYTDTLCDNHVIGAISQRNRMSLRKSFRLCDIQGNEIPQLTDLFEAEWFKEFVRLSLESIYWGHSLIELGNVRDSAGVLQYDNVSLVPRKHVIPELGTIIRSQGDDPASGTPYRTGDIALTCVEVGRPDDLGLLLPVSGQAIPKRHMMAFWDQFGEIFGMPMRIAKTTSRDERDRHAIARMLEQMGASSYGVFPDGTDLDIKESSRSDAYSVYDQRINRANSEISKAILNQTMTIEAGSSLSQSEVHLDIFKSVCDADADMIRDVINHRLLPRMLAHGFPVQGARFDWDESPEYTPEQQRLTEEMILRHYQVDPAYFQTKYNIQITGVTTMGSGDDPVPTKGDTQEGDDLSFFA